MDTKNKISTTPYYWKSITVIIVFILTTSCQKEKCTSGPLVSYYDFELPVKLTPVLDTFNIGDTILVEQKFSDQIRDLNSELVINLSSVELNTIRFAISDLLKPNDFTPKQNLFAVIGNINPTGLGGEVLLEYKHEQNLFENKFGIQITQSGLYNMSFGPVSQYKFRINTTKCPTEEISNLYYILNNRGDNNFHMMKDGNDTIAFNLTKEEFDKSGGYCFYVK